ncbi:ferrous iron transport protein A [Egbenema bharatensis]|uniref:ferrous iron transport protein A n=1 Tax=Egbenema bharatensis TaxID=3463334 RepID=UPI003A89D771
MFNQGFVVSGSSLKLLRLGERGVVSGLSHVNDRTVRQLKSMGITPGTSIVLEQRFPRFVVKVGRERFALSHDLIQSIYVRV